jgi:hypothetical protein
MFALAFSWGVPRSIAARRPNVVVLVDQLAPAVSPRSLLLAVKVQFDPYDVEILSRSWVGGASEQRERARAWGQRLRSDAVVWYQVQHDQVVLHVFDRISNRFASESFHLGQTSTALERSMAVAARTLLRATLRARPPKRASSVRPPARKPRTASTEGSTQLHLAVGYQADLLPGGVEWRHGPRLGIGLEVLRRFGMELCFWHALSQKSDFSGGQWTRRFFSFSDKIYVKVRLLPRLTGLFGAAVDVSYGDLEARDLATDRLDQASTWEVLIGAVSGLRVLLTSRISMVFFLRGGWLPLSHRVVVQQAEVSDPGTWVIGALGAIGYRVY